MLLNSSLQVVDSVSTNFSGIGCLVDVWKYIAIVEFIFIVLLVFLVIKNNKKGMNPDLFKAKSADIDTDSMLSDIFKSKDLYDKLIRKCHPDRFVDQKMKQLMTEISQEVTKNKHNYALLCEIKNRVEVQYNLKIE